MWRNVPSGGDPWLTVRLTLQSLAFDPSQPSWSQLLTPTETSRRSPLILVVVSGGLYGVVGGTMTAIVYNFAASFVGGIELELS